MIPTTSSRNPAGMLSQKARKTMGLSVPDLFDNFIGPRGGLLPRQEFDIFWQTISAPENGRDTVLILRLFIKTFIETCSLDPTKRSELSPQSILNTIYFMALLLPVKADVLLKKIIANWYGQLEGLPKDSFLKGCSDVIGTIHLRFCEEKDALENIISQVHLMHTPAIFHHLSQNIVPTFHKLEFPVASFPFIYQFILSQCHDKNSRMKVLGIIRQQLHEIHDEKSGCILQREHSLLSLLHLLRSCLVYWRSPTGPFIQAVTETVTPFFHWPLPHSLVARRILLMLKQEMLAPGNSILEKFAAESRVPETTTTSDQETSRSRPIFYVMDKSCTLSSNFSHMIGIYSADVYVDGENKVFASGLSTEVQALLLLNILHSPSAPIDPNDVYKITEEDVAVLFGQTVNVLQESLDISPEDAVSHRERNFALIRSQFTKIARSNEQRGISSDLVLPPVLSASLMPPLPEIAHLHWLVIRDYSFPSLDLISQLGCTPYPKTPLSEKFEKILRLYNAFADVSDPVEIRICIAGSDSIIHQVATAYVELLKREIDPLKGILLRFFVIPFRNSMLASFIARYDSWYHRQLYVPMVSKMFLLPSMTEEEPQFNDYPPDEPITPFGSLLQSNIENYLREAEYTFQVKLFQIEGWRRVCGDEVLPDLVIPLVQRAEIGRVATAMLFKNLGREGTMATLRDVKEVFRDKDFNYTPLEFYMHMTRVDSIGAVLADDERKHNVADDEPIPFDRICLSNVPSADDPCFPPSPKDPWLEMFAKVSEHKAKVKNRYSFLIQEPLQHINELKLTAAREDQSFRVVVDGESFGPFKQVRISRIEDNSKKHVSLNIATFFPIQI